MNKAEQQEMDKVMRELAELSPMEYDTMRDEKAKELGVRVGTLDQEVAKRRADVAEEAADEVVEELSPWEESVSGDDLLAEIRDQINAYTVMDPAAATAVTVWSLASFCLDGFRVFPKLQLKSPEKRCGKSTLMECMEGLTCRPLLTTNITASALFRCIEAWHPTLLIDEADTFAKDNDELNGIINAGHTRRTAYVIRTVKEDDDHKPKKFCVWGAQVIAGIKNQRDTLEDRSITIEMRRKMPSEAASKIPIDYFEQTQVIRRKCLRWAEDHVKALKQSAAVVPACGNDRAQDNWFPLFVIAQLADGSWPERVLSAYQSIEHRDGTEDDSIAVMLLADIKSIFKETDRDRIHSTDLVDRLVMMEDRPWPEWKHGKPMTKTSLSKLLKPHNIQPKTIRIGDTTLKGYNLVSFQEPFDRYLSSDPPVSSVTPSQPSNGAGFSRFLNVTSQLGVTVPKRRKPSNGAGCNDVTVQNGDIEGGYPDGLLEAAATAVSGLPVSAGAVIADLESYDYQDFIDHPETARSMAERMAFRK